VAIVPKARLPAISVEPLVKVMLPTLAAAPLFPTETAPVTVKDGLPTENVRVAVPVAFPTPKEAQVNVPSTVTVWVAAITTASTELGGPDVVW
jgi:hypothetical protein